MNRAAEVATSSPLAIGTRKIVLEDYALDLDIGFLDIERGHPQRVTLSVEVVLDEARFVSSDDPREAWDYDVLRTCIDELAKERRYNLQETLAKAVYDWVAARPGVVGIRVATRKVAVYPNCSGVGVELLSRGFAG